jgi:hypothetical protein
MAYVSIPQTGGFVGRTRSCYGAGPGGDAPCCHAPGTQRNPPAGEQAVESSDSGCSSAAPLQATIERCSGRVGGFDMLS